MNRLFPGIDFSIYSSKGVLVDYPARLNISITAQHPSSWTLDQVREVLTFHSLGNSYA